MSETLFDFGDRDIEYLFDVLSELCENLVEKHGLPDRSLIVTKRFGDGEKTKGQLISLTISISEPFSPFAIDEKFDSARLNQSVMRIAASKTLDKSVVEIDVPDGMIKNVKDTSTFKVIKEADGLTTLRIKITSDVLKDIVVATIESAVMSYKSKLPAFGCCDLYKDCSAQKKCIHKNKLFATACQYKKNLEKGLNFYE